MIPVTLQDLQLTVHREHVSAQRLYEKVGVVQTGQLVDREPVYQLSL